MQDAEPGIRQRHTKTEWVAEEVGIVPEAERAAREPMFEDPATAPQHAPDRGGHG